MNPETSLQGDFFWLSYLADQLKLRGDSLRLVLLVRLGQIRTDIDSTLRERMLLENPLGVPVAPG